MNVYVLEDGEAHDWGAVHSVHAQLEGAIKAACAYMRDKVCRNPWKADPIVTPEVTIAVWSAGSFYLEINKYELEVDPGSSEDPWT